jgi:L-lactate dehydrogenase complex protein LldE
MRVSFFVTCLVDQLRPEVGHAAVALLERAGCTVRFDPRQTCCGQPAFNSGYRAEARRVARGLIEALEGEDAVVTPSGSCCAMTRHFDELFSDEPEWRRRGAELAARTHELSAFLAERLGATGFGARVEGRASWHDSCHALRELGQRAPGRRLLEAVDGLELVEAGLREECCGFGGTFAVKNDAVSVAMADRKIDEFETLGVDFVTGADLSCLLQLGGRLARRGSRIRALHFAELIAGGLPAEAAR